MTYDDITNVPYSAMSPVFLFFFFLPAPMFMLLLCVLYLLCAVHFLPLWCLIHYVRFRFWFWFRFFIHQVLQQGKCLESGKHTNISKQQHWHTSTSNPFALTKQHPNAHTHTYAHTHIHTPARARRFAFNYLFFILFILFYNN